MILHYIKVALRNLERQKMLTFINVLGLSLGLACFSLFLLYAVHEFSYDRFHTKGDHIYRVYEWWKFTGRQGSATASATPIGPAMKSDLPDVDSFVRIQEPGESLVRVEGKLQSAKLTFADRQILTVFTFPLLAGDASKALNDPASIVLTRSKALQFFGTTDVLGRQMEIRENEEYKPFVITGVAEDLPPNSTIRFDMLGSFDRVLSTPWGRESASSWTMTIGISVYVLLRPGSTLMDDPGRLAAFRKAYFPGEASDLKKQQLWDGKGAIPSGYGLQPLADVHTNTTIDSGASDPKNIWILISISGGVLAIACINFIILSIGGSVRRSKEVGARKISGGRRKQLIFQFLSESMLLTLCSALLGLGIAQVLLPFFNEVSGRSLTLSFEQYPEMIALLVATILVTGVLAGSYPALILSALKPVEILKNKVRLAGSNFFTRSLVTFQFVLSVGLIIATVVILRQLSFMHTKDLGFEKEQVVMVAAQGADYKRFCQFLQAQTSVGAITASSIGLGADEGQMGGRCDLNGREETVIEYPVEANFLEAMGIDLVAGRNFNALLTSDTVHAVIVNETLVSALNTTPEKAVGMQVPSFRKDSPPHTIIGVARDFHYEDLKRKVRSQWFVQPAEFKPSSFFVKLKPGHPEGLQLVESAWKKTAPDLPFRYSFLDQKFDAFYRAEERWASIIGAAGNVCIFLACLGLFGLASLTTANRTKEVGIRKVLGASVISIIRLLCRDFAILVILAVAIASPLAWYAMDKWLSEFAYKIELSWLIFVVTGLAALSLAVLTIGVQALRAALASPVRWLRSE
jgi:putative ABC transport system permease protein